MIVKGLDASVQKNPDIDYEWLCHEFAIEEIMKYFGVENAVLYINASVNLEFYEDISLYGYKLDTDKNKNFYVLPGYDHKIKDSQFDLNMEKVWRENKQKVSEGIPIVADIDMYYLNYVPEYHKMHATHSCILYGYSDDETTVNIIDYNYQEIHNVVIPIEDFLKARSSYIRFSLIPREDNPYHQCTVGNRWYELDRDGWNAAPLELLYKNVCLITERFTGTGDSSSNNNRTGLTRFINKVANKKYTGFTALKRLQDIVAEYQKTEGQHRIHFLIGVYDQLLRLKAKRRLLVYSLSTASKLIKADNLGEALECAKDVSFNWELLVKFMVKNRYSGTDESYVKVINKLSEVIDKEEKLSDALLKLKQSIDR